MRAIWVVVLLAGCQSEQVFPEVAQARQGVLGGAPAPDAGNVVAVRVTPALGDIALCTGFLVSPNLVMTARHCVSEISGTGCATETVGSAQYQAYVPAAPVAAARFSVTQALDVGAPGTFLDVSAVHVPALADGGVFCGNDVALLELSRLAAGAPLPLRIDAPVVGEGYTAVGYGQDGADPTTPGVRRQRSGGTVTMLGPVRSTAGKLVVSEQDFVVSEGPCGGDSGGPALDGQGLVIGVMSRGNPNVCTNMIYTQVAPHRAWVKDVVVAAAARAGIAVVPWVAAELPPPDAGAPDAGAADAGSVDAGTADAGAGDAGLP
ncbi:MAG: S1 family peptidase, partial [Myxococcaceae bacterium]|nr:S1 family peptidase [Myxococcaceae bacterium]